MTTPPMYPGGANPADVAVGDFNSDGKLDAIIATDPPLLFLGNGDGTFLAATSIGTIAASPTGAAVADFNQDGHLDVAFATANGAVVYLGNGNGTFGAAITFPVSGAFRILAADVNHDGFPDLILNTGTAISVLIGNGRGGFRGPIVSNSDAEFMAAGDFNGDGNVDLATSNGYDDFSVMLGNGHGLFTVANTYSVTPSNISSLAIADYNRDGSLDVALPNGQMFLGNGNGSFRGASGFPVPINTTVAAAADLNGDGIPDLVTTSVTLCVESNFGTAVVFLGNGDGSFQPPTTYDSGSCNVTGVIGIGDFNNDNATDLVVLNGQPSGLIAMINKGNGTFPAAILDLFGGAGGVAVADFNQDGDADVVAADGSVYLGNADGTLRFDTTLPLGGIAVATGDFDNDRHADVAAVVECAAADCSTGGELLVALGDGSGNFSAPTSLPSAGFYAEALTIADFNHDGNLDVAIVNNCTDSGCSAGGAVAIYRGDGTGAFSLLSTLTTVSESPLSIVSGDFNNDGMVDLAVGGMSNTIFNPGVVNIFLGNGDGTFQSPIEFETPPYLGISALTAVDINQDGILDLVVANGGTCDDCGASGSILYGNGDGTFAIGPAISTDGGRPFSVVAEDFYGVGGLTPVFANECGSFPDCPNGSIMIDGTQNISGIKLEYLAAADFNDDGKPDLVGSLQLDTGVSVLVNVGAALSATNTTISPSAQQSLSSFEPITFTSQIQHTGPVTVTGMVQFNDAGVSIGSASITSSGAAWFTATSLAAGSHFIVAYYQGDSNFASSNSLGVHVTVSKATTATALTSKPNPSRLDQPVTFTATIRNQYGGQSTGTITFLEGSTLLGNATISGNVASFTTSSLAIGTHSITATYGGDINFVGSTSNTLSQVVAKATSETAVSSSKNPSVFGKPVTFKATVSSMTETPTGKVQFLDGTNILATVAITSGSAQYTTSKLPVGSQQITAVYEGDTDVQGSKSVALDQMVVQALTRR